MQSIHTIVHLGISALDCETMPTLILFPDANFPHASFVVARYVRYLQREGHASYRTITRDVRYIGLLFDYYFLVAKKNGNNTDDWESLIEDFMLAFDTGSVLGWSPANTQDYTYCKSTIKHFGSFVNKGGNKKALLPNEERELEDSISKSYLYSSHLKHSLLFHVKRKTSNAREQHLERKRGRKRDISGSQMVKYFPPEYVPLLIEETKSVRDKIFLLMLAYGGRRQCEVNQLFVNDIEPTNGRLGVQLAHPSTSSMSWINKAGKKTTGTRAGFLQTMYGLKPRIDLGSKPTNVGWKGMKFDDVQNQKSYMWFIREEVEKYLLVLHMQYMRETRSAYTHHPYYFVDQNGEPLKLKSMQKQINAACKRLEKKYGICLDGLKGHSLRHHYGFYCADVLKLDLLMIRKYMGHKQLSSTAIYTHISPEKARLTLQNAQDRAKLEKRIEISVEERLEIQNRFTNEIGAIKELPLSWKASWLGGDELDPMLISR